MIRISGARLKERALIRRVERACFRVLGQENFFVIDMTIVDEGTIKELNAQARGIDRVTDVLSFPCFEKLSLPVSEDSFSSCDYDGKRVLLGSIMICRQRAMEQATEYGHSYARELGFLACHGFLHILGYDHIQPDDEAVMLQKQREIMSSAELER